MSPFRRILVALARRDSDRNLLQYAAMVGGLLSPAEIVSLHVSDDLDSAARIDLAAGVSSLLPSARCEFAAGDILDAILNATAACGADLILVGHAAQNRRRSLARRLAMQAPCSVWMIPDQHPASIHGVLIPIDFSRISADSLNVGTAISEAAGLDECLALHVSFNEALATFDEFDDIVAEDRDRAFGIFVAPIDLHGVWAKPLFVDSCHVAPTIIRTSFEQGCDLIVMGTRGRSPSAAVLLGSVTEQCMMTTPVPILVLKHFGARLSLLQALRDERVRKRGEGRFT